MKWSIVFGHVRACCFSLSKSAHGALPRASSSREDRLREIPRVSEIARSAFFRYCRDIKFILLFRDTCSRNICGRRGVSASSVSAGTLHNWKGRFPSSASFALYNLFKMDGHSICIFAVSSISRDEAMDIACSFHVSDCTTSGKTYLYLNVAPCTVFLRYDVRDDACIFTWKHFPALACWLGKSSVSTPPWNRLHRVVRRNCAVSQVRSKF